MTNAFIENTEIENKRQIKEILRKRGIREFVHFTDVRNIPSIIDQGGIITRQMMEESNMAFYESDSDRFYKRRDSISLSISFPNYPMFYKKRCQEPDRKWCVFSIDAEKVIDKCIIINAGNAAAAASESKRIDMTGCVELFESLFDEQVGQYKRNGLLFKLTTDPQAEVLCLDKILLEDIKKCYFNYDDLSTRKQYEDMLVQAGIRVGSSKHHFDKRNESDYYKKAVKQY